MGKPCLIVRLYREGCIRKYACPFFISHLHRHTPFAIFVDQSSVLDSSQHCISLLHQALALKMIQKVAADDQSLIIPEGLTAKLLPWLASGLPMSSNVKSSSNRKWGGTKLLSSYLIPGMPKKNNTGPGLSPLFATQVVLLKTHLQLEFCLALSWVNLVLYVVWSHLEAQQIYEVR